MSFSLSHFWRFCSRINVNTKELGVIRLDKPFGTQRWVMGQIAQGLHEDCHSYTILKCRQIGLSTISLALDLYWVFRHVGLDATIVVQDESAHNAFRTQLDEYYRQLPRAWKPFKVKHNRTEFAFRHPTGGISRLQYQIAGTKAKGGGGLGRSKGNAFLHATEMSSWGDQEGLMSLKSSLAEVNPNRLFVWESTARGFNGFYDIWNESKQAMTQRGIFVSWWAHELYRLSRDDPRYKTYWGLSGKLTVRERQLSRDVMLLYGDAMEFVNGTKEIAPEQWAWYRWMSEEKVGDESLVDQEFPTTEHMAFVVTGSSFFTGRGLSNAYKRVDKQGTPDYFRVEVRHRMVDTHILSVVKKLANLCVWETPVKGAFYVIGADPAYGSSDWADRFAISVWRCYADRVEQVAEFCDASFMPYSFAWVLCYLAGCYTPCWWNLEVNGPGAAVLGELDNLKKLSWMGTPEDRSIMKNFLGGMREFFYRRPDQISGVPTARGTKSTLQEKERYMNTYRDMFERGIAVPHSLDLLHEMKSIVREEGSAPAASGRNKDDRVIAGALAIQMWADKLRMVLFQKKVVYEPNAPKGTAPRMSTLDRMVERQRELLGLAPVKLPA